MAAATYRAAGLWTGRTLGNLLRDSASQHPNRTAVVAGGRRWTYAELDRRVDAIAAGTRSRGLDRGERVVVQLPSGGEFLPVLFGLARAGVVPVLALPAHRRTELTAVARAAQAVALVVPGVHARFDHRPLARAVQQDVPSVRTVVVAGDLAGPEDDGRDGWCTLSDLEIGGRPAAHVTGPGGPGPEPSDTALVLLSGGTTGTPKLIARTHDDYAWNAVASADAAGLDATSTYLAALPVAHNFTLVSPGTVGAVAVGATVVVAPSPDPATVFGLVARHGVTHTAAVPSLLATWLDERLAPTGPVEDLSSLRVVQVGGARLDDTTAAGVQGLLGARLQQVFGMAEGLNCYTALDDPDDLVTTTQGRPLSEWDEIRVVDDAGHGVPDGAPGHLLTRGPATIRDYLAAPAGTDGFTADGFYRTGDLVRRLPSGHLVVVGRAKELVNRSGEKISPAEVEGHLLAHPGITAAAVVAVPDPERGERTVAVLVGGAGVPDRRTIAVFFAERGVAAYKVPDAVVRRERLPLTAIGKIDRAAVLADVGSG
ncbi:(2,3-dihydroxybenzoyl)adenylate synthase [Kineococcus mangrovi]|uniref:(2,3-dihydroxybenzoyl)adenylate synthase n=1 Tax=Kineococcus mangrovi TaxID=1660183 RepID=UPI003D7D613E